MMPLVKICGLSDPDSVATAVDFGASMVGFVFYPPSPRAVTPAQASGLARAVPSGVERVGLFVDATDAALDAVLRQVPLDVLQLHGAETPNRVATLRKRYRLPVIKAIKLSGASDLAQAARYETIADWLLFDAKPPRTMDTALPGGNGLTFDWQLLAGRRFPRPWLLSGGLDADNLADAVRISGAHAVDVSSGIENAPGVKDPERIRAFLAAAARL